MGSQKRIIVSYKILTVFRWNFFFQSVVCGYEKNIRHHAFGLHDYPVGVTDSDGQREIR